MTGFHVVSGAHEHLIPPRVRRIGLADIRDVLRRGVRDFSEQPSHYVFMCLIFPIVGLILITWASAGNALHLVFPLVAGFAIVGPFAAIGLYEVSRRREQGLDSSWKHGFALLRSPAIPAMVLIGLILAAIFTAWLLVAQEIYVLFFGAAPPESFSGFIRELFTTRHGWSLLVAGNLVGALFSLFVLTTTSIAFPLLLDRDCGAYIAIQTSVRVMMVNPVPMLMWGLIVAALLVIGSLPILVGLAVVIPILGHSTWHLYRKTVD